MKILEFMKVLEENQNSTLSILLPNGEFVPPHFHITEVGKVHKEFIDCGGTLHNFTTCVLQVWTAQDVDHRLNAGKLLKIITLADAALNLNKLSVGIEYGAEVASQFVLVDVKATENEIVLVLTGVQTDCLAKDKCGVANCCSEPGCCC